MGRLYRNMRARFPAFTNPDLGEYPMGGWYFIIHGGIVVGYYVSVESGVNLYVEDVNPKGKEDHCVSARLAFKP